MAASERLCWKFNLHLALISIVGKPQRFFFAAPSLNCSFAASFASRAAHGCAAVRLAAGRGVANLPPQNYNFATKACRGFSKNKFPVAYFLIGVQGCPLLPFLLWYFLLWASKEESTDANEKEAENKKSHKPNFHPLPLVKQRKTNRHFTATVAGRTIFHLHHTTTADMRQGYFTAYIYIKHII